MSEEFCEKLKWNDFAQVNWGRQKILILSTKPLNIIGQQVFFERIDKEKEKEWYTLYRTYEFTDNFAVFEQDSAFPTIFNYVQMEILSLEEAWQALLEETSYEKSSLN